MCDSQSNSLIQGIASTDRQSMTNTILHSSMSNPSPNPVPIPSAYPNVHAYPSLTQPYPYPSYPVGINMAPQAVSSPALSLPPVVSNILASIQTPAPAPALAALAPPAFPVPSFPSVPKVQGDYAEKIISDQIALLQQQLQTSLNNLQMYSVQLDALQVLTQSNSDQSVLQQYQDVYQQYSLEFTNTLLLNQCIENLVSLQQSAPADPPALSTLISDKFEGELETALHNSKLENYNTVDNTETTQQIGETYDTTPKANELLDDNNNTITSTTNGATSGELEEQVPVVEEEKKEEIVSDLEEIKKNIRGILNKMTGQNFNKLSREMADILHIGDVAVLEFSRGKMYDREQMEIGQRAQLKALIKLILKCILEKAVHEPLFSNQYARLCYSLFLDAQSHELKRKLLRTQLLSLCHLIFKKSRKTQDKVRFNGIVIMIGQLFSYGLISWNVILSGVLKVLLPPSSALDVEALCNLLKTAGNDMDRHHFNEMNGVMQQMRQFAEDYDFRTKCFVREIEDIRNNGWKMTRQKSSEVLTSNNNNNTNGRYRNNSNNGHRSNNNNRWKASHNNNNNNGYRWKGNNSHSHSHNNHNNHNNSRRHHHHSNTNHSNGRKSNKCRPSVDFVGDVTLPDRSRYPSNQVLTKTWAMRNSGDQSWGDNVELVYFKGHSELSLRSRYAVRNVASGEEVQVSADIRTPNEPGRYCTYFRLQKNGVFFGPRVWVDIIVEQDNHETYPVHSNEASQSIALSCQ